MIAIRAGTLVDGNGGTPLKDAVILMDGERIRQVGPAAHRHPVRPSGPLISHA